MCSDSNRKSYFFSWKGVASHSASEFQFGTVSLKKILEFELIRGFPLFLTVRKNVSEAMGDMQLV